MFLIFAGYSGKTKIRKENDFFNYALQHIYF